MCWCHSLILRHASENSQHTNQIILVFFYISWYDLVLISLSLYMVKHYWSFCYHWHTHIMSIDCVNTQTRFMVLFTSRSLLTCGEILRHLVWPLPQVFACHLPLINYTHFSFTDITLWQNMTFSCKKQTSGKKIWLQCGGTSTSALPCISFNFLVIPRWNCPPWMVIRLGGRTRTFLELLCGLPEIFGLKL